MKGEEALLAWLSAQRDRGARYRGDDAALLRLAGDFAITIDSQEEGVHFPATAPPATVARRTLAVNLSDLAACGAVPRLALLALAAPRTYPHRRFLGAFARACEDHGVALVGGDLTAGDRLRATAVVLGRRPPQGAWLRRSAARVGDRIWVGGSLGESAAGCLLLQRGATFSGRGTHLPQGLEIDGALARSARRAIRRHLAPTPQLKLGQWLSHRRRAAALDLSDGLAKDLARLCAASGVGAVLEIDRLPVPPDLEPLAQLLDTTAEALALSGGEDYVLLFTLPAAIVAPVGCTAIGLVVQRPGVRTLRGGRDAGALEPAGFDHVVQR